MPTRRRRVVWAPRAKRDLLDVWRYYAHVASPEIADKLLRDIEQAVERVSNRPLSHRPRDEVMPGLRTVLVHPYTVFYRAREDGVEIARVLHERERFCPRGQTSDARLCHPTDLQAEPRHLARPATGVGLRASVTRITHPVASAVAAEA